MGNSIRRLLFFSSTKLKYKNFFFWSVVISQQNKSLHTRRKTLYCCSLYCPAVCLCCLGHCRHKVQSVKLILSFVWRAWWSLLCLWNTISHILGHCFYWLMLTSNSEGCRHPSGKWNLWWMLPFHFLQVAFFPCYSSKFWRELGAVL